MKGISRIDSKSTHGWFVRTYRYGKVNSKMYSDGVHGGRQKALTAARKYLKEYVLNNPPPLAFARMREYPPSNNTSGVVGVSETFGRGRNGQILPCFSASWRPRKNLPRTKSFYFSQYGSREAAFEAAVEFRKEKEEEIRRGIESI